MFFPFVNICFERTVDTEGSLTDVRDRLERWADVTGFRVSDGEGSWLLRRGSFWAAGYTFDIRKVSTQVVVAVVGHEPLTLRCTLRCRSFLGIGTPGDSEKLEDDFDLLIRYLCERRLH
jgi:hypothetical protein